MTFCALYHVSTGVIGLIFFYSESAGFASAEWARLQHCFLLKSFKLWKTLELIFRQPDVGYLVLIAIVLERLRIDHE